MSAEESSDFKIRKLPRHLYIVNPEAYEPQMIAIEIGKRWKSTKWAFWKKLLQRRGEDDHHNVRRYAKAMGELQERTLSCYIYIYIYIYLHIVIQQAIIFWKWSCFMLASSLRCFASLSSDNGTVVMNKFRDEVRSARNWVVICC